MAASAAPKVAVIGGGISGSLCAVALRQHGLEPVIFDKGRRSLGGRLGTLRRSSHADVGAQFFHVGEPGSQFAQAMHFLEQNGMVASWQGRFGALGSSGGGFLPREIIAGSALGAMRQSDGGGPASKAGDFCGFLSGGSDSRFLVGTPSMAALSDRICRAVNVSVQQEVQVAGAEMHQGSWRLSVESPAAEVASGGPFQALVIATHNPSLAAGIVKSLASDMQRDINENWTPPEAAEVAPERIVERLRGLADSLLEIRERHVEPACTLTVAYPAGSLSKALVFDAAVCPTSEYIRYVVREASKPGRSETSSSTDLDGRSGGELWTAVSTPGFAAQLLSERDSAGLFEHRLRELLARALKSAGGGEVSMPAPLSTSTKLWRAGFVSKTLGLKEEAVCLQPWRLAICGDFIRDHDSPLEAAVLSGLEAGERVASWLVGTPPAPS